MGYKEGGEGVVEGLYCPLLKMNDCGDNTTETRGNEWLNIDQSEKRGYLDTTWRE
jgi:hypothetical protein